MKIKFLQMLFMFILSNSLIFTQSENNNTTWFSQSTRAYFIHYTKNDSALTKEMISYLDNGIKTVENYFGQSFTKKFDVYVFPSRQSLDVQWGNDWGIPDFKSECWMVASGVAHRLDLLSPLIWKTEACEHNSENKEHVQQLITHELVHVYHGQHNPIPDFSGMDDIGWLVEGIAVLISGQLNDERIKDLAEAKEKNKLPSELKKMWSGKYRYAVCGSLVNFVQEKWGKETIFQLLNCTNEEEILKLLHTSESKLLDEWKHSIPTL